MCFEPGNPVVLKSGGPAMTVVEYLPGQPIVRCAWFTDGNEHRTATFPEATLRRVG